MAELHNGTPFLSIKIPLVQVEMVANQLRKGGKPVLFQIGEGLAKAKRDLLNGSYVISAKYFGVKTGYSNEPADYMTKVGELKKLYDDWDDRRDTSMEYFIEKLKD